MGELVKQPQPQDCSSLNTDQTLTVGSDLSVGSMNSSSKLPTKVEESKNVAIVEGGMKRVSSMGSLASACLHTIQKKSNKLLKTSSTKMHGSFRRVKKVSRSSINRCEKLIRHKRGSSNVLMYYQDDTYSVGKDDMSVTSIMSEQPISTSYSDVLGIKCKPLYEDQGDAFLKAVSENYSSDDVNHPLLYFNYKSPTRSMEDSNHSNSRPSSVSISQDKREPNYNYSSPVLDRSASSRSYTTNQVETKPVEVETKPVDWTPSAKEFDDSSEHAVAKSVTQKEEELETSSLDSFQSAYSHDSIERFMHQKSTELDPKTTSESKSNYAYSTPRRKKMNREQYKVYILLLHFPTRRFELIQTKFFPKTGTIGNLINSIPSKAQEFTLGFQKYRGLCRPRDGIEMTDHSALAASKKGENSFRLRRGEILIAIPEGYTGTECKVIFKKKLLYHPKLEMLLERTDPFGRSPSRRRSPAKNSGNFTPTKINFDEVEKMEQWKSPSRSGNTMSSYQMEEDQDGRSKHQDFQIQKYAAPAFPMEKALREMASKGQTDVVAIINTTDSAADCGARKKVQTIQIVTQGSKSKKMQMDDNTFKIFSGVVAMLLQRQMFRPGSAMSPMGAQGFFACAAFFAILNYIQEKRPSSGLPSEGKMNKQKLGYEIIDDDEE